eukprot:GFUD01112415.1.p1 GENE.GFUD01112415.1~~GFUD01112415.1.p1  ORF type:complete len:129 (+),score=4.99 GFUD01112415.1:59-445(+)
MRTISLIILFFLAVGGEDVLGSSLKGEHDKVHPRVKRAVGVGAAALASAGATLLTGSSNSGQGNLWQLNGKTLDANKCWADGTGPCPNGNCLDYKGQRGTIIKEQTVDCKWYCFHRAHCKTQICCKNA